MDPIKISDPNIVTMRDPQRISNSNIVRAMRARFISSRNSMDCEKLCEMFVADNHRRTLNRSSCMQLGAAALHPSPTAATPTLIVSSNHYRSVNTHQARGRTSAPPAMGPPSEQETPSNGSQDEAIMCPFDRSKLLERREFHKNFANRVNLGSDKQDKRNSNEIETWQTELKDLIWLHLQAWHAERTPEEQDKFLCAARKDVPSLLEKILHYRFNPVYRCENRPNSIVGAPACDSTPPHSACMLLCCKNCQQQEYTALREVEELMTRLEMAEALFPSSNMMGTYHPTYVDPAFVNRVKAMCLWYNVTKDQRLRLMLIGKQFRSSSLPGDRFQWPPSDCNDSELHDAPDTTIGQSICDMQAFLLDPVVRTAAQSQPSDGQNNNNNLNNVSPYRRYIEHIMKSDSLAKSLSFLHRMHNVTVRRVQLTLERQASCDEDGDFNAGDIFAEDETTFASDGNNGPPLGAEQAEELRRYGAWSPEAQSLKLPSYAPTFVFLSVVPLEIMHEYLRMRIASRPEHPNPLSLEQLLKEVREALILAMTHRERFNKHIHTAFDEHSDHLAKYMEILAGYDATVGEVMAMYLEYVEGWVLGATPEVLQKSAVVREWSFTKLIAPMIRGQHSVAALKFCRIVGMLLQNIGQRLQDRIDSLNTEGRNLPMPGDDRKTVADKAVVLLACREMQSLFTVERENSMRVLHFAQLMCRDLEQRVFHRDHEEPMLCTVGDDDDELNGGSRRLSLACVCPDVRLAAGILQKEVIRVRNTLTLIVRRVQSECSPEKIAAWEEADKVVAPKMREILHQSFKFGFDYHKELVRLLETHIMSQHHESSSDVNVSLDIIEFARMWMVFATRICERGRGVRPRWATHGLDFLIAACDQANTKHLMQDEFECLKVDMEACIAHVIGTQSAANLVTGGSRRPSIVNRAGQMTRTPSPCVVGEEHRKMRQQLSAELQQAKSVGSAPCSPLMERSRSFIDATRADRKERRVKVNQVPALRQTRIRETVKKLDKHIDQNMRDHCLIGQVKTPKGVNIIQVRSVNFSWHRGIKIGQGRFGKVYTAVNHSNGELMAMKQIAIQANDARSIQKVAEELKIFEGISHKYLVKYYGIEVHREELLIFMGLCAEGTLESLVSLSGSLHEGLTRRFTAQLLTAVDELHKHGVVHRDVKTANIFLTNGGSCLKLGDFGSAVKIQGQSTVPGELKGYAGTFAYMAPEVFSGVNGHGRAADIWSIGCVTVEMASGKRPWSQFTNNCQVMFKVGINREKPEIPSELSSEGQHFVQQCLEFDVELRWPSYKLLQHNFCKVDLNET